MIAGLSEASKTIQEMGKPHLEESDEESELLIMDECGIKDLYRAAKPLLQGLEIYKKIFDTSLLITKSSRRYDILNLNKRVTPD